jgi:hypothetical protein
MKTKSKPNDTKTLHIFPRPSLALPHRLLGTAWPHCLSCRLLAFVGSLWQSLTLYKVDSLGAQSGSILLKATEETLNYSNTDF